MFKRVQNQPTAPRLVECPFCDWTGRKSELVIKVVEPDFNDVVAAGALYIIMLASPPTERVQYWCPRCEKLIASDLHYRSSLFNEDSFPD